MFSERNDLRWKDAVRSDVEGVFLPFAIFTIAKSAFCDGFLRSVLISPVSPSGPTAEDISTRDSVGVAKRHLALSRFAVEAVGAVPLDGHLWNAPNVCSKYIVLRQPGVSGQSVPEADIKGAVTSALYRVSS